MDNKNDGKRGFETETEKPYRDGGPMDPNRRPAIQTPMHPPPSETPSSEDDC